MIVSKFDKTVWTKKFILILFLSLSYLYCLPLLRTGIVAGITASEVRLYDLVFFIVFFVGILPMPLKYFQFWYNFSKVHRLLFYWLITAFIWLFFTLYLKGINNYIIGLIRFFRFFSFCSIFLLGFTWVKNKKQLNILFDLHIYILIVIGLLGTFQSVGILPNFWPSYYSIYWEDSYLSTSTLAPNHTHYSIMMAFGIIMIVTKLVTIGKFSNYFLILGLFPMIYSMIASQGRSGWLILGIYFLLSVFLLRKFIFIFFVFIFSVLIIFLFSNDIVAGNTSIQKILLYRTITAHEDTKRTVFSIDDENDRSFISRIDDDRWKIYVNILVFWKNNPLYPLIGAGFQNSVKGIGGQAGAAHNAYLNIIAEQGLLGFIIYVKFLISLFRLGWSRFKSSKVKLGKEYALHWVCLYVGVLFANFFGEIIYPGRALFTFLGSFFFTVVLFLHPVRSKTPANQK